MNHVQVSHQVQSYGSSASLGFHASMIHHHDALDDCLSFQLVMNVRSSFHDILQTIATAYRENDAKPQIKCYSPITAIITHQISFITVQDYNSSNGDFWAPYDRVVIIQGYGSSVIKHIRDYLKKHVQQSIMPIVTWQYLAGKDRKSQGINIVPAKPIHHAFYPWIKNDIKDYFDQYLASESSVLVLLGEAGTAKTSLIRSLIWHASLHTIFTYDDELMKSDAMFADFIAGDAALLVVEDADVFLRSRHHDGNTVMTKFLNISDGLASNGIRKKIIFTANITDVSRIDPALLRAGRCFDCMMFRRLTYVEACEAAKIIGMNPLKEEREYTLAELFAESKGDPKMTHRTTVGYNIDTKGEPQ